MTTLLRRFALLVAVLGLSAVIPATSAEATPAYYLWIASGEWPTEAECVYWKNWSVVEYENVVEPKSNDCFRNPSTNGYFYRIRNEF
jgi:hypothetical protein